MSGRSYGATWRTSEPRRADAVEQDIRAELEAHLALRADAEVAEGCAPDDARARATEAFGDFEGVVEQCRRVRLEEMYVMQNATMVLMAATVAAVLFLAGATFAWRQDTHATLEELRAEVSTLNASLGVEPSLADGALPMFAGAQTPREIVFRVGDRVSYLDATYASGISGDVIVARDGKVLLEDIGWFHLEGLTRAEAERELSEAYAALYADAPDIKLLLEE